ncbi:MAG: (2Fe-2S)-binding protein [Betaproteobacteria bacterium]|nr:(2Fe-2S)-binding protein [Betaproteobacteria bacterium]
MPKLLINGAARDADVEDSTPLLWVLRDALGLTGCKFGCGVAACGACSVLVDGQATRACVTPVASVVGKAITTIEGAGSRAPWAALREAWIAEQVPQCGYCQSGMLMASIALLETKPNPSDSDIDTAITNICRCGTYPRIRKAIRRAAAQLASGRR